MRVFKFIILLFTSSLTFGQSNPSPILAWKTYPVPKNKDTLYKYNSDPNDWYVFLDSNKIFVEKARDHYAKQKMPFVITPEIGEEKILKARRYSVIEVDDGYLIAFFRGEFGGLLYWISKDKKTKYKVANSLIAQFIMLSGKLYAIEGLSHGLSYSGSIVALEKENNKWVVNEYLKLPSAPTAVQVDSKNNFIVVTSASLLSIDQNKVITSLIPKGIWDIYLYPSSMVIQNDVIFIGMRKGIFKYNLLTKEEEWLLPY